MITILFILLIIAIVSIFSVQNAAPVVISFLTWRFEASLAVVIVLCVLAGIVTGVIITLTVRRKSSASDRTTGSDQHYTNESDTEIK